MKYFLLSLLLLPIFVGTTVGQTDNTTAQNQPANLTDTADCDDISLLIDKLDLIISRLGENLSLMDSFYETNSTGKINIDSIFIVDPLNRNLVEERLSELKSFASGNIETVSISGKEDRSVITCSLKYPVLKDHVNRIKSLEISLAEKKIKFLSLPIEKRRTLIELKSESEESSLPQEITPTEKVEITDIIKPPVEAETPSEDSKDEEFRKILTAYLEEMNLTAQKINEIQIQWSSANKNRFDELADFRATVSKGVIISELKQDPEKEELKTSLTEVNDVWRRSAKIFSELQPLKVEADIKLPPLPKKDILDNLDESQFRAINLSRGELLNKLQSLKTLPAESDQKYRDEILKLILNAANTRAYLLAFMGYPFENDIPNLVGEIWNEFQILPYRIRGFFIKTKDELTTALENGWNGYYNLGWSFLKLLLFLLSPWFLLWIIRFIAGRLLPEKVKAPRSYYSYLNHVSAKDKSIRFIVNILPWAGVYFFSRDFLSTFVDSYSVYLSTYELLIRYIALALSIKIIYENFLEYFFGKLGFSENHEAAQKIHSVFAGFIYSTLIMGSLLAIIRLLFTTGYLYDSLTKIFIALWLIRNFLAVYGIWNHLIKFSSKLVSKSLYSRISKLKSRFLMFLSAPFLLILLIAKFIWDNILFYAQKFDFVKLLLNRLLMRKIKPADSVELNSPDSDYLSHFAPEHFIDAPVSKTLEENLHKIRDMILKWNEEESEDHSICLHGDKGLGKSYLIYLLKEELKETDLNIIHLNVPSKIVNKEKLLAELTAKGLDVNIPPERNGEEDDTENSDDVPEKKTVVLLDNCHNVFLSVRGRFKAFHALTEQMNLHPDSVFWVCCFNKQSWKYLVLALNAHIYFKSVLEMTGSSYEEIREMILWRNEKTNMTLHYDRDSFAVDELYESEAKIKSEKKYFSLLWENSDGIPLVALSLWKKSVYVKKANMLTAYPPEYKSSKELANLSDEQAFILAAIIRHENLTEVQTGQVTSYDLPTVRQLSKLLINTGIIQSDKNSCFRISPLWWKAVYEYLLKKNFLIINVK